MSNKKDLDGLKSWNEIGEELGISAPYAYTIYKNAIKKLQDEIGNFLPEDQELIEDELRILFTK